MKVPVMNLEKQIILMTMKSKKISNTALIFNTYTNKMHHLLKIIKNLLVLQLDVNTIPMKSQNRQV